MLMIYSEPTQVSWSGGTAPYYLSIIPGEYIRSCLYMVTKPVMVDSWSGVIDSRKWTPLFLEVY